MDMLNYNPYNPAGVCTIVILYKRDLVGSAVLGLKGQLQVRIT